MNESTPLPDLQHMLAPPPYSLGSNEKAAMLIHGLRQLTRYHQKHCAEYRRILDVLGQSSISAQTLEEIPFLPVRIFKEFDLLSIERQDIFKTMTSSGTSGQQVSRIYLDRETASLQSKTLARLMAELLGKKRLPMLIIDSPSVLTERNSFSARGAGILGFSIFGNDVAYALDDQMNLDLQCIEKFLSKHAGKPIFLFGFTSIIWQHFHLPLQQKHLRLPIDQGILLHGGGWKKLQDQAVGNHEFREALAMTTGIKQIVNYYGMVEQSGAIFLECPEGHLHASVFSDILIRDSKDFSILPRGHSGLIEVLSLLPRSYPGHALLTEDIGTIQGEDDCTCGRLGKYFSVSGRVAQAETRGCSDTYAPAS